MRYSSLTLAVLATSVAAVPHRRHPHPHAVRRDAEVVTTSIVEVVEAVLYVDQNGNPYATTVDSVDAAPTDPADPTVDAAGYGPPWGQSAGSGGYGSSQPTPTSTPQDSSSEASYSQPPQTTPAPPTSSDITPATSSAPPPQSASPDDEGDDGEMIGYSIAYAPYNPDNSCKSQAQVDADFEDISKYSMVRIYGTDCNQVPMIMSAAKQHDMKVFAGIYDINNAAAEAQLLVEGVQGDWSRIHSVSVGNEVLSNGASLNDLTSAIGTVREALPKAGYEGPITTVEVYSKLWEAQYKSLCDVIDYVAVNCHPYFDTEETAEDAGNYVRKQANKMRTEFCDKDVVITESGWPTAGETNGNAVPSLANQRIAIKALSQEFSADKQALILFSAYDDPWKPDNKWGVEHYWGIHGTAPSAR